MEAVSEGNRSLYPRRLGEWKLYQKFILHRGGSAKRSEFTMAAASGTALQLFSDYCS